MTADIDAHQIRPTARIINTIGKGLIKDDLAAVMELVKNSFDADSPDFDIEKLGDEINTLLGADAPEPPN